MCKVAATELPAVSRLKERLVPGDFLDCYSVTSGLSPRPAAEIITSFPGWAACLLTIRGMVIARIYLATILPLHILIARNVLARVVAAGKNSQ